jgi:hypothetical protein
MNQTRYNMLSNELKVLVTIYSLEEKNEVPYFSSILHENKNDSAINTSTLHTTIDHLVDLGSIDVSWDSIGNMWVRKFAVNSITIDFVRTLYRELDDQNL